MRAGGWHLRRDTGSSGLGRKEKSQASGFHVTVVAECERQSGPGAATFRDLRKHRLQSLRTIGSVRKLIQRVPAQQRAEVNHCFEGNNRIECHLQVVFLLQVAPCLRHGQAWPGLALRWQPPDLCSLGILPRHCHILDPQNSQSGFGHKVRHDSRTVTLEDGKRVCCFGGRTTPTCFNLQISKKS